MEKLSSHFMGQGSIRSPDWYWTAILRTYIRASLGTRGTVSAHKLVYQIKNYQFSH
jgi:hypothetical protein